MSALDTLADRAQAASRRLAGQGGIRSKLAAELADDAKFLRDHIGKRAQSKAPGVHVTPVPPAGKERGRRTGGTNPFVVVGVALVAGVALAKWIDWRGHAHPRG
jgi:hypothetical protein